MFRYDNPFMTTLCKIGDLFILSILWMVCSLPIITIVPASAALYYVVVKTIRKERGSAVMQFWKAFRQNLACGIKVNCLYLLFALVTMMWFMFAASFSLESLQGILYKAISRIILVVFGLGTAFLMPLLARFYMQVMSYWKYSFFLGFRHFGCSVLMLLSIAAVIFLIILLPPLIIVLPAALAFELSFFIEPVLAKYTVVSEEDAQDLWFGHTTK